jgi:hypothetical protein
MISRWLSPITSLSRIFSSATMMFFGEQAEQPGIHLAERASGLDVEQQVMTGILAMSTIWLPS